MVKIPTRLKQHLGDLLQKGCEDSVEDIKDVTPIWSKRLYDSTRATQYEIDGSYIRCRIVAGGVESYGITREQNVLKEVNYGKYAERRHHYMSNSTDIVTERIQARFQKK